MLGGPGENQGSPAGDCTAGGGPALPAPLFSLLYLCPGWGEAWKGVAQGLLQGLLQPRSCVCSAVTGSVRVAWEKYRLQPPPSLLTQNLHFEKGLGHPFCHRLA